MYFLKYTFIICVCIYLSLWNWVCVCVCVCVYVYQSKSISQHLILFGHARCVCTLLMKVCPQQVLIQYPYSTWTAVRGSRYTSWTKTFHIESHALKKKQKTKKKQLVLYCSVVPLVIIKCQLYLVSVHSRCWAPCNAMLHVLYFVFQIPRSDLEFQVMNSGCAACTINVVHFTILLFVFFFKWASAKRTS